MAHEINHKIIEWVDWLQWAAVLPVLLFILWFYWQFRAELWRFVVNYVGLTLILAALFLMVFGLLGAGLGIPYLFWHDDFLSRSFSSMGATMLLTVVGIIAYYLDPSPWATERKTKAFLEPDEQIKARLEGWYSRRLPVIKARPVDQAQTGKRLRWWNYVNFGLNLVWDPISITPLQPFLEPNRENSQRLQRFLRVARGPFLLLLLTPALLPAVFNEVPHAAPTGKLGLEKLMHIEQPPTYDVSRNLGGYLLGLASWLLGIQAGVLIIKVFIRCSTFLHRPGWGEDLRAGQAAASTVPPGAACPNSGAGRCDGPGCLRGDPDGSTARLADCRARTLQRLEVLVFAAMFLGTFALFGLARHLRSTGILGPDSPLGFQVFDPSPAFAICALLAVLAMGYSAIASQPRSRQAVAILSLVAWFGIANHDPFKNRFENLGYDKGNVVSLRSRVASTYNGQVGGPGTDRTPVKLVSDLAALDAWKAGSRAGEADVDAKSRPKLVLVVVSGGATRSAYWTSVVLDQLERSLGSFGRRVRIISGASGGMLGAACYVTYRRGVAEGKSTERKSLNPSDPSLQPSPSSLLPDWIRFDLPLRSMDPLAWGIAVSEVWKAAWPGFVPEDRGVILEKDWTVLRYPFAELAPLEEQGKIPSIIFSPMMVEDGRRLLISNLDLSLSYERDGKAYASSPLAEAASRQINPDQFATDNGRDGTERSRTSLSSLEYFRIFREPEHRDLFISTAVRMSASFPFVSPAVNLPTDPPRRMVDAGYYDNYGVQVAAAWIHRNRNWLALNTSGVLLVQIRDSSSVRDRMDIDDTPPGMAESIGRGFQFFTSPVDAFSKARYTTASFRNDGEIMGLDSYNWDFGKDEAGKPIRPEHPEAFFTTVIFENSARVSLDPDDFWSELSNLESGKPNNRPFREVSMSWYLARAEMEATARAIPGDPPKGSRWADPINRRNMIQTLHGQVFTMMTDDAKYQQLDEAKKDEMRKKGYLCYPPGPERDIRLKRLEQLRNYERMINLKRWWEKDKS
ncbi:patatin-like phospholipase family protein [Singulisphaera sp. PoT]|uniref:patatin-like phospholipase family protein n=1 Tax=Singulisphaera sp. PoT TaxID=3411797 RepID=UPI003BF60DD8